MGFHGSNLRAALLVGFALALALAAGASFGR
jgi:hypothetical protein